MWISCDMALELDWRWFGARDDNIGNLTGLDEFVAFEK